ncbi:MAG: hypothetical protein RR736_01140 [Pseudomonas sp.]|uniref:hypothetical protein n=1 Tax=Pseudomonas sp. TaxID=306 RepID=UPI002FC6BF55
MADFIKPPHGQSIDFELLPVLLLWPAQALLTKGWENPPLWILSNDRRRSEQAPFPKRIATRLRDDKDTFKPVNALT